MKKFIIGNWKMYLSPQESVALARSIATHSKKKQSGLELIICPSHSSLALVGDVLKKSQCAIGAQDVFWEEKGAYTGEESVRNLQELGCSYVIVGHSERRRLGETDEVVSKKVHSIIRGGLIPILCIGETKEELQGGKKNEVITRQLSRALSRIESIPNSIIIAYEPVWAIGTGMPETPRGAGETHVLIREFLNRNFKTFSGSSRIIYGGSINAANVADFLHQHEIEGALIGGASTKATEFLSIIEQYSKLASAKN